MSVPQFTAFVPEWMPFLQSLAVDYERGSLTAWPEFVQRVRAFYTPAMMGTIEAAVPGWKAMSAYADGTTLIHVTSVLVALLLCPEYRAASPAQQTLMQWIVLFHDIGKQIEHGKRDHTHGFRSAAYTGKALPQIGFDVPEMDFMQIDAWAAQTEAAVTTHTETGEAIQDNAQLATIISGIDQLFGQNTPAAQVIKAVLLHMSISVVTEYPQMAPLTESDMRDYIDGDLWPLLRVIHVVDNDAWSLFDAETKQRHRDETLAVFEDVKRVIEER